MPTFQYIAKEGPDRVIDGTIEANNVDMAINKIIQQGYTPIDVAPASTTAATKVLPKKSEKRTKIDFSFRNRISLTDLSLFTRQMSDLVDASVPMLRSLQIVANQTQNPRLKEIVVAMYEDVKNGASLSDALGKHPKVFSTLFVNMVRTGEVGGNLEVVLLRLADYYESEQQTRSKIQNSLAYPVLILVVGIVTVFVLLAFVIPRLTTMFDELGQELPAITRMLIGVSGFFAQFWWAIILALGAAGFYFFRWLQTDKGRHRFDTWKLKIPVLGELIKIVEIGRFSRTMGTLIESGVVITAALSSVWATINNSILRDEVRQIADEVKNGSSLKAALSKTTFFPDLAVNMISVGEETGHLDRSLLKVADTYEKQSDRSMKTMLTLLEPALMIIIVLFVGFLVVAMLLPIFKMNTLIQ